MPDPKDYLDEDVTYVHGHVRRKRGTVTVRSVNQKEYSPFGIIVWCVALAIEIIFVLSLNPIWIMQNILLVLIIMALILVAAIVVVVVYRRNKQKSIEKGG